MMSQSNSGVRAYQGSPYRTFEEFFSKNGVQSQVFSINPCRRSTLVGEKGTRLTVFPFSLVDALGRPVEGEVEISLKEVFSKKEMVLSNRVTTSEDRLLESGGQIFVQAFQSGRPLQLSGPMAVELPLRNRLRNPLGMRLFKGAVSITRAFRSGRDFDWEMVSNKPVNIRVLNGSKYFAFNLTEFNWWNCDYFFAKKGARTMVSARCVSQIEEFDDLTAFLVFRDTNSVARMYPGEHSFTSFNIPLKLAAAVVMMGIYDGQLFLGTCEIDQTSNKLLHVRMGPVTEEELLKNLDKLA
jgi:hypothetical protein